MTNKFLLVFLLLCSTATFAQNRDYRSTNPDSLEQALATNPPAGEELAHIYRELMYYYVETNTDKAMDYALKCSELSVSIGRLDFVANSCNVIGRVFYKFFQYDSAMVYYEKIPALVEQMRQHPERYDEKNLDNMLGTAYGNIGNLYTMQGVNHKALEYYHRGLPIFEKYGQKQHLTLAYYNIGELYRTIDNTAQAEINLLKMDSLAHENADSLFIAYATYSLAALYNYSKQYDKALANAEIAYAYFFSHPEEGEWKAIVLCLFAYIHLDGFGNDQLAEEYARRASKLYAELRLPDMSNLNFAQIYLKRRQWLNAEQAALAALTIDDSDPHSNFTMYKVLAKVYAHLGKADKAGEYLDALTELQASWSNKNYQSSLAEMETKYETEKKKLKIAALEDEKRMMTWLSIAAGMALLLTLAAFFFLWRWIVQKKRLADNREKLAEQQIKQLEKEKQLIATQSVLDGEVQERARLARDLHDGLGSMLTGTKLCFIEMKQNAALQHADEERFNKALELLDDSVHEMRRVAHHLMPDSLSRFGLKPAVSDFCNNLPSVEFRYYGNESRLESNLEVMIYRCLYELVNNALKHARASQIIVQIVQDANRIGFVVQDNGIGFDPLTEHKGIGLLNIRTRVASFGGIFNIDSKEREGTEISIELKIRN